MQRWWKLVWIVPLAVSFITPSPTLYASQPPPPSPPCQFSPPSLLSPTRPPSSLASLLSLLGVRALNEENLDLLTLKPHVIRLVSHVLRVQPDLVPKIGKLLHKAQEVVLISAQEANAPFVEQGYFPPHHPAFHVLVIKGSPEISVFRVWGGRAKEKGTFAFMENPASTGTSKPDTRRLYSVPPDNSMEYITVVNPEGADFYVGITSAHPEWGEGDGLQVQFRTIIPDSRWVQSIRWIQPEDMP